MKRGREKTIRHPQSLQPRWARILLTSAYLDWCRKHSLQPEEMASCLLYNTALENGAGGVTFRCTKPGQADRYIEKRKETPE